MCAQRSPQDRTGRSRIEAVLTWLGGGEWPDLIERHERSSHAVAGVVVLANTALAWLVATLAVGASTHWPTAAVASLTLVFGVLVGAVTRATASGQARRQSATAGRAAVAVAVGVLVGELAALVVLSGPIDRRLDEQAARTADAAPAVVAASADLDRQRAARAALDSAVDGARARRDEALVVARCEYNPSPACPQTRITGVPGPGPETSTADDLLADAQKELDDALAARDGAARGLDAAIADGQRALAQARQAVVARADRSLGARWVAMADESSANAGVLAVQLLTVGFFVLLSLLPLILRRWRGETTHDRGAAARAERERAELDADTAIAVKRAQVRAEAEALWAEQQLANARLAVEAQTEIDRAAHRRRVADAVAAAGPVRARVEEDMYLPIAAEAEAASLAATNSAVESGAAPAPLSIEASAAATPSDAKSGGAAAEPANLPARAPQVPTIPGVARAAARWIRPLVPPIVVRAIDSTTHPLRAARQVFEEVEEITFTLKRTHTVSVHAEERGGQPRPSAVVVTDARATEPTPEGQLPPGPGVSELAGNQARARLAEGQRPRELPRGPRQLPPAG